jgi:protein TonB
MNGSLKTALTYAAAFAVAAAIHLVVALGAGEFFRSPGDRIAESEDSALEETLTLTFHRPQPVRLQPRPAVPVTRVLEPLPASADAQEVSPQKPEPEIPDPTETAKAQETAQANPEQLQPAEDPQQSPVMPQPTRYQSGALPTIRIERPRPLQPIDVEAVYPLGARLRGEEGAVRLVVRIGEDGRVDIVEIGESSGFTTLDRAAERAVRRTPFAPATRNGQPVIEEITITVRFRLDS